LKLEYHKTLKEINDRVSLTLAKNEESMQKIKMMENNRVAERRRLVKEFARLMRDWEEEAQLVQKHLEGLTKSYDEKNRDLEDLVEFEVLLY
jgi:hypothetical protein